MTTEFLFFEIMNNKFVKTMRKQLQILILLLLSSLAYPQVWTPPVDISNLSGYSIEPDMAIDNNGVIHVVWSYRINDNYWKIMYSKSVDGGITWGTPYDVVKNTSLWMSQPHIACDNDGRFLYLTYDYNTGDPGNMLIYLIICDRGQWSSPMLISTDMPGSEYNKVILDNNDRVYVFWIYAGAYTFYRYQENDEWSVIMHPYYNNLQDLYSLSCCKVDSANILKWVGYSTLEMPTGYYNQAYFEFNPATNQWSVPYIFTGRKASIGNAIALDKNGNPQIAFREITNDSTPPNTGTFYTSKINQQWSKPELVIENDPEYQQIIATGENIHIVDVEKTEDGFKLVHYKKNNAIWESLIVDTCFIINFPNLKFWNNQLMMVYSKTWKTGYNQFGSDIFFTRYDIPTGIAEPTPAISDFKIYPNPGKAPIMIDFSIGKQEKIEVSIYDLNGRKIVTVVNEDKTPGRYQTLWNGRDQNGKEVNSGLYLVRLQWGRNSVTRPVEYSKQ